MLFKKKAKDAPAGEAETPAAGGGDGEGGGEAAPAKKKLPVVLIAAVAGGVVLIGGGGAATFFLMQPKPADAHGEAAPKKKAPKKTEAKGKGGKGGKEDKSAGVVREGPDGVTFYTLPDLVVNIQSTEGRPSFLKLKLTFELSDPAVAEAMKAEAPRLQDMFQTFLRELRPEDLAGSQGGWQLRQEILRRVNLIMAPDKVDAVLIEEMLIQ